MISDIKLIGNITVFGLVGALLVLLGALTGAKLASLALRRSLREKVAGHHLDVLAKVVYYLIVAAGVMWSLSLLGVGLSGLMVAGGVAGLVLGFASQQIVGNLISGVFLIVERPIKIGDQVHIEGISGFVEDIRMISTTIRTYDGLVVRVPNEKVFTSNITNFVALGCRRIDYNVSIRYQDDAEQAMAIIKRVLEEHPYVLVEPAPQVFVDNLGDDGVELVVRFWAPIATWYATRTELLWPIKKALEEKGIEIPFPQRVVWFAEDQEQAVEKANRSGRRRWRS